MALNYKPIFKLDTHKGVIRCLSFHPSKPLLASGGEDKYVYIWDCATRKALFFCEGKATPLCLAWTEQDDTLHCGFADGYLLSIRPDDQTRSLSGPFFKAHSCPITCIAVHQSGKWLATAGGHDIRIWSREDLKCVWRRSTVLDPPPMVAWNARSDVIVTSLHWMQKEDIPGEAAGCKPAYESSGNFENFDQVANSSPRNLLVSYRDHGVVRWDIQDRRALGVLNVTEQIASADCSPDSCYIAVSDFQGNVDVYDVSTGLPVNSFAAQSGGQETAAFAVKFIHAGEALLVCNSAGDVVIFDLESRTEIQALKARSLTLARSTSNNRNLPAFAAKHYYDEGDVLQIAIGSATPTSSDFTLWQATEVPSARSQLDSDLTGRMDSANTDIHSKSKLSLWVWMTAGLAAMVGYILYRQQK
ncbi:WD40-repeat-containing domain protein [Hygrophoropsis aurantiaca]|uniref:WD40-repeat-containing domain protein n=1 Tax=Hygrophoropsis aurantiaca TaxID=72124 RepID=A0ACB8A8K6_9AGAM|nr:WD40-repeat-containing domain protein [Hygrophoropsis aurantiaca]